MKKNIKIHFIGISGIGMSAIAELMQDKGYFVQGSDKVLNDNSKRLKKKGIKFFHGHYKKNISNVDAVVYSALNKEIAKKVKSLIKKGLSRKEIVEEINQSSQLNLKTEMKKYEKGNNEIVDAVKWEEGISKDIEKGGRQFFVHIKEVLEPTYKTLEDARGIITSDYQNHLEKEWIKSLREKYDYSVDSTILEELKSELK